MLKKTKEYALRTLQQSVGFRCLAQSAKPKRYFEAPRESSYQTHLSEKRYGRFLHAP